MGRRQSKKQKKKQKARERRNHKDRSSISARREAKWSEQRIRKLAPLPEFRIDATGAVKDIVDLVETGVAGLDQVYVRTLDRDTISLMGAHVSDGWTDLVNGSAASVKDMTRGESEQALSNLFEIELGNGIIRNAPENLVRRAMPSSCFTMSPGEHHWDVNCRSLMSIKTASGRFYQSPHKPEIVWNKEDPRSVVFTHHALKQLADRILPSWKGHYVGQAYVFGFFYECVYFEVISLQTGQPALVVYNACLRSGRYLRDYMRELLGLKSNSELAQYYYKVGYLPLVMDDDLAIAKTFLTPGYRHTPERRAMLTSKSSKRALLRDVEQACDEGINIMSVTTSEITRTAVKWFHNHGVPQAKKITCEVFRDMAGPYSRLSTDDLPTEAS